MNREHQIARDSIVANMELVNKYTAELQKEISELHEFLTIASWYLSDEQMKIDKHYKDMPVEHLKKVSMTVSDYAGELVNMESTIRQCLYLLNRRFTIDNPDISNVKQRVIGYK